MTTDDMNGECAGKVAPGSIVVAVSNRGLRVGVMDLLVEFSDRLVAASSERAVLEIMERLPIALVVVELSLADEDPLGMLRRIRSSDPSLPMIVLTLDRSEAFRRAVLTAGADRLVFAPEAARELPAAAGELLSSLDRRGFLDA